jgi:hypothetical protein
MNRLASKSHLIRQMFGLMLLTHVAWLAHLYLEHGLVQDDSCEICQLVQGLENGVAPANSEPARLSGRYFFLCQIFSTVRLVQRGIYLSRAPPCLS